MTAVPFDGALLQLIVDRLLENGVPTKVVARSLSLDHDMVCESRSRLRVKRYGTDDKTELMEQLQWDMIYEARVIMAEGSSAEKARYVSAVLGKEFALAARKTPESQVRARDGLLKALEEMKKEPARKTEKEDNPFVARIRQTGTDA